MKLALSAMEHIIRDATAKEIDFLLYIMRFQDNLGIIRGITMEEVCDAIKIHKSKFYDILQSLEKKMIIRILWNEKRHSFWSTAVIDNSFVGKEDYRKGYINLNTKFLWSDEFLALTKCEKVICLKILSLYRENRKNMSLSFKTLAEWTGSKIQSIPKYIESIKSIFHISVNEGMITIDLISCFNVFSRNPDSESEIYNEHFLNYILAAKKVKVISPSDTKDTLTIFKTLGGKCGNNAVVTAIIKCIDYYGELIPKYINKLTQIIGKNKNLIEIFY